MAPLPTEPERPQSRHDCNHEGDWGYMKGQLEKLDDIATAMEELKKEVIILKTQRGAAAWIVGLLSATGGAGLMGLATKLFGGHTP